MKNNQPQLHVTSTLIARESITLHVISMNTERIHTPWLGLVRGASSGFGRGSGWARCQCGSRRLGRACHCPLAAGLLPGSRLGPGGEGSIAQRGEKQQKGICTHLETQQQQCQAVPPRTQPLRENGSAAPYPAPLTPASLAGKAEISLLNSTSALERARRSFMHPCPIRARHLERESPALSWTSGLCG